MTTTFWKELTSLADWQTAQENARHGMTLIFKHSNACELSAGAFEQFQTFLRANTVPLAVYLVVVQTARPVSNDIETVFSIRHESPQAILLVNGKPAWNDSHRRITAETLKKAVEEHATAVTA